MRATINGVTVEGTPAEIAEYTGLLKTKVTAKLSPAVNTKRLIDALDNMIETANSIHSKRNNQQEYSKRYHEEEFEAAKAKARLKYEENNQQCQQTMWMKNEDTQAIMGMGEMIGQKKSHMQMCTEAIKIMENQ